MTQENPSTTALDEQQLGDLLGHMGPRPQPSREAMDEARASVMNTWQQAVADHRRRRHRYTGLSLAASVLLMFGIAFGVLRVSQPESPGIGSIRYTVNAPQFRTKHSNTWEALRETRTINVGDSLRLGPSAYAVLTLENGLEMRLDSDTEVEFLALNRLYLHSGAIYADAPGDASLIVETAMGVARDIGTRFEVRLRDATRWSVQVREGKVLMHDKFAGQATARAGERVSVDSNGFERKPVGSADASWRWTYEATQPLAIDGESLRTYLVWWGREMGLQIDFAKPIDAAIAHQTLLHGDLEGMSMEEGFAAVLTSSGYTVVDRDGNKLMLTR